MKIISFFLLLVSVITCGCTSEWDKRKYCNQIGRDLQSSLNKSDKETSTSEKNLGELNSTDTSSLEWTYCKAVDTCLADVHRNTVVWSIEKSRTAFDSRSIVDLMKNDAVLKISSTSDRLTDQQMNDFDVKRDEQFPNCFSK